MRSIVPLLFLSLLFAAPACADDLLGDVRKTLGHDNLRGWEQGIRAEGTGQVMGMPARCRPDRQPAAEPFHHALGSAREADRISGTRGLT